jgi:hypothetical protein
MLSIRSNFLRGFASGVEWANVSSCASPCFSLATPIAGRGGASTKRFAGVSFLSGTSDFGCAGLVDAGVCTARALRRPD